MAAWHEGYVSDIPYSLGFYRETTLNHLAFCLSSSSVDCAEILNAKRVLELGFGMGVNPIVNAAVNPDVQFEGIDFNPEHVLHAKKLAEDAKITNVHLREASFQDLAEEANRGQHDVDIIIAHGILTWVSEDARSAIVDIASKRLRPGGVLYVSYNAMPGWAPMMPLQRLMRENSSQSIARSDQHVSSGFELAKALVGEGAKYFAANPGVAPRLEEASKLDAHYLAHEYLNENWTIFYFADIAKSLNAAKLKFLASASIAENMDSLCFPAAMLPRVAKADPIWKETLRDYAANTQFRRDIFGRGRVTATLSDQMAMAAQVNFHLAVPRSKATLELSTPLGKANGNADLYLPILDSLDSGPKTLLDLMQLPVSATKGQSAIAQAAALLVHSGQVLPSFRREINVEPARRFNELVVKRLQAGKLVGTLAAPVVGGGLLIEQGHAIALSAVLEGYEQDIDKAGHHAIGVLKGLGRDVTIDGKKAEPQEAQAKMRTVMEDLFTLYLPVWRRLGVL